MKAEKAGGEGFRVIDDFHYVGTERSTMGARREGRGAGEVYRGDEGGPRLGWTALVVMDRGQKTKTSRSCLHIPLTGEAEGRFCAGERMSLFFLRFSSH